VMVSLAAVWQAAGVTPDAVVGHSQGEIAAACVAGVLSLDDAAKVVALRSQALRSIAGRGGMLSIAEPADRVRERIGAWGERVSVAAVNGPAATVVSGELDALAEIKAQCESEDVRVRMVPVDYASHCAQVERIETEILAVLDGISPDRAWIPMVSAMTGEYLDGPEADASYWYASLRNPVEFDRAVRVLADGGHQVFIEVSPHPVLAPAVTETLDDAGVSEPVVTGTLRRDDGGPDRFLASLAEVQVCGVAVDWRAVLGGGQRVELPTYAFQRKAYWPQTGLMPAAMGAAALGLGVVGHPLLQAAVELAGGAGVVCTGRLSVRTQPWLGDHAVGGTVLLPGTAFVELAVAAGDQAGCGQLDELTLEAPLILPAAGGVQVQVVVAAPDEDGTRGVEVFARPDGSDGGWARHASGVLSVTGADPDASELVVWPPRDAEPLAMEGLYEGLAAAGYGYGPAFQGLRAAWRHGGDVYAEVALPGDAATDAPSFGLHPALLDAAFHATVLDGASLTDVPADEAGQARMPFAWQNVALHATGAGALRVRRTTAPVMIEAVSRRNTRQQGAGSGVTVTHRAGLPVSVATMRQGATLGRKT